MTGRPSKYQQAYCNEVIETMGMGLSLTAFGGVIGVSRQTLNNWMGEHAEFFDAVKIGQAKRVHYLETTMLDGDAGPKITARIFALKNADPDEWQDKRTLEHSGELSIKKTPRDMTDDELAAIASQRP